MSVEACSPITRLAAHRPFDRKISYPAEEIAMQHAIQGSSGAAGSHRRALPEPDVNLSAHPAPSVRPFDI